MEPRKEPDCAPRDRRCWNDYYNNWRATDNHSTAKVSLISKGLMVERETSNAAYIITGVTILSAAAVGLLVLNRKSEKATE